MIAGLKPYPVVKASGVSWLGQVPEHWEVLPALAAYRPRQVKNVGMIESTVLSLSYGRIVIKPPDKLRGLVPESFETYQVVDPGNIIVRTTDLQNDQTSLRIGHSQHRGIITSAYMCLEVSPRVSNEFGYQHLNAYDLLKIIYGFGSGLRQNLDFKDIKRMPVLIPPLGEQAAVVRFLGFVDRRIQRYIRAKQKLIKLLEEQKQAINQRAVTRGLDPDVRLKPSDVEWLSDVPEHWHMRPLKHCIREGTSISYGIVQPGGHTPGGVPFVQTGNLTRREFEPDNLQRTTREIAEKYPRSVVRPGDVLLGIRASVGKAAVAPPSLDGANLSRGIARIALGPSLDPHYLALYLQSQVAQQFWSACQQGTTFNEIPIALVRVLPVLLPPLQEQRSIVAVVQEQNRLPDAAIERARKEIELLREYRTRLIGDVVTGKLDVREAAARLQDEADELEPSDETDEIDEGEEQSADEAGLEEVEA